MTISDHGITVTIKYGKAYDDTWAVFKGERVSHVFEAIAAYFGIDHSATVGLTLHELVSNATQIAHGTSTAATILGAVAIPDTRGPDATSAPSSSGNPWAGLGDADKPEASALPEHPQQAVLDALTAASDIPALQRVWATNQTAFGDPDVVALYKARGKELSA